MKNLSVLNTVTFLSVIATCVLLLFAIFSFYRNYQTTSKITNCAIIEVQTNLLSLKEKLDENINHQHKKIDEKLAEIENELARLNEEKENKSNKPNVQMTLPIMGKEEIEIMKSKEEEETRLRESVDVLVQRMGSIEETINSDKIALEKELSNIKERITIVMNYAQDVKEQLDAKIDGLEKSTQEKFAVVDDRLKKADDEFERIRDEFKRIDEEFKKVRGEFKRVDDENRLMSYNYDVVLDIQKREEAKKYETTVATENIVKEEIIEENQSPEEPIKMTEKPKKDFFLIRFFKWIGRIF